MSTASVLAALSAFAGCVAIAGAGADLLEARSARLRGGSAVRTGVRGRFEAMLRRLGRRVAVIPPIRGLSPPGDLEARLAAAGEPAGLGLREWIALKAVSALLGGMAALLVGADTAPRIAFLMMLVAPIAGFTAPDLWLARVTKRRLDAAVRDLPDMLDLLRVTVEAGMPPARAIGVVGAEFRGTLAREWTRVAAEIQLGVSQEDAFAGLYVRIPADELGALVESLTRARRYGVPLGRSLDLQAGKARERMRRQVRERAARAGPKVQLVVALFLVPAVLLIVAAGLLVELGRSGLFLPV